MDLAEMPALPRILLLGALSPRLAQMLATVSRYVDRPYWLLICAALPNCRPTDEVVSCDPVRIPLGAELEGRYPGERTDALTHLGASLRPVRCLDTENVGNRVDLRFRFEPAQMT
jgi:hypothetical protein